jgi:hypothetical protein
MSLYTAEFGLTELRLYTTAFMAWISVVLIFFLLTVLRGHRRYFAFCALVSGFFAIAILNALDPDALIVRTNVARLEAGKEFDAPYLASLSADAVPPLLDSLPAMNQTDRSTIQDSIGVRWSSPDTDWRTYNIARSRARAIVGERGL